MGAPNFGEKRKLDDEIFEIITSSQFILKNIAPIVIQKKYVTDSDFVRTEQILNSFYRTPGEERIYNKDVLVNSIIEGVKNGLFGLGTLENGKPKCNYFKESPNVYLSDNEIIIKKEICEKRLEEEKKKESSFSNINQKNRNALILKKILMQ